MNKLFKRIVLLSLFLLSSVYGAQVGDVIVNTADINYTIGGIDKNTTTNEVNNTIVQTPATIEFLQINPGGTSETLQPTTYEGSGATVSMPDATLPDGTVVTTPSQVGVVDVGQYGVRDLVLIRVTDLDQNINMSAQETVDVNVTNPRTGEVETLHLMETGANTGVFVGYTQTVAGSMVPKNGYISVQGGDKIEAIYVDNGTTQHIEVDASIMAPDFKLLTTKEQSKDIASIGEFVKYTVVVKNTGTASYSNIEIIDQLPDGLKYQKGSFRVEDTKITPILSGDGKVLSYTHPELTAGNKVAISYVALIGAGIIDSKAINRAWASTASGNRSNIATTTLKIKEELYRSKGFILGRIYDANITCGADKVVTTTKDAVEASSPVASVDSNSKQSRGCGIEGVKLYMEDGRFVVTDKDGKYHFVDIANGSHVVQMDDESFKGRYKLAECRQNTRFAGSMRSQFVDIYHGELKRVDFCLERIATSTGKVSLSMYIKKIGKTEVELVITTDTDMNLVDPEVFLALSEGLEYIKSSISNHIEPKESEEMLAIKLGSDSRVTLKLRTLEGANPDKELRGILYFDTQVSKNQRSDIAQVVFTTDSSRNGYISKILKSHDKVSIRSVGGKTPVEVGDYSWTKSTHQEYMPKYTPDQVDALGSKSRIVWPSKGWIPDIPSTRVAILYPRGSSVELRLNGEKVSMLNYEGVYRGNNKQMQIMHFKGVDLRENENIFTAIIKARGGKIISRATRVVFVESHAPKEIRFLPEYSYLVADGKHEPIVAVKFIGPSGHLLRGGMVGAFSTDAKHAPAVMSNGKGQYSIDSQGIAYVKLKPTAIAGEAQLSFKLLDGNSETISVRLKPHLRDWILVGFAEGTIGYNTLHGNKEALNRKGVDDKWYHKGRVAFFAKGRIKGKWLMTMAYDSGRGKNDRKLFDKIDANAYYTLYNDATTQGSEAPSTKKLYLKLERDEFSILFGDYSTGLDKTELSSYNRSFTGIKSEYHGKNIDATLFVAENKDLFFRDELRGDGTRGYYRLSQGEIISGSESITIEVRDRYREEIIIESKKLSRYRDYDIDYDKGTLYFKETIYSTDRHFNPRYIVAKYEVDGDGKNHYVYGGRVGVKSSDEKYQAGITYINEERGAGENTLYGMDASIKLSDKLEIKAEYAKSESGTDSNKTKGDASKVTIEYKDDNLSASVYYRKQDSSFGLDQLSESLSATRKIGADATIRLSKKWDISSTIYQNRKYEDNGSINNESVFEATANYKDKLWYGSFGYRYADNSDTEATHQITTKIGRDFFDGNLSVWLSHDQSLGSNEDKEFPTKTALGVDYKYDENTTLFGTLERRDGSSGVEWHSRIGAIYEPWEDSKITFARLYDSGKDGSRIYDTMGLTKTMLWGEKWKVKLGYEKGIAWDNNSSSDKDFDAFTIGVGYTGEKYSSDMTVEYRNSDIEEKLNFDAGLYIKQSDAMGLAVGLGYHNVWSKDLENRDIDLKMAFVYRPEESNWMALDRLDYIDKYSKDQNKETKTHKLINNLHLNWQANDDLELGFQYGIKSIREEISKVEYKSTTDLIGASVRYDINEKWSFGVQGSVLHSYTANNIDYGFGAFVDTTVGKNTEFTLGYNIEGFDDDDFSQQNYYHEGPFVRFRMKFDQSSVKGIAKGIIR